MGKAGRFACILVPMLCTLASLIIVIILSVAGTNNSSMKGLRNYYLFRVDTRNIGEAPAETEEENVGDKLKDGLLDAAGFGNDNKARSILEPRKIDIEDFYTTYLWSHCWGTVEDGDKWETKDCTKPKFFKYEFDLQKIADDHSDTDENIEFPQKYKDIQKSSNWLFKFMGLFYALGALGTAITFVVGWFGLLSRWGSCVTLIFADAAFLFILGGSIMSTVVAYGYKGAFNELSEDFGVTVTVGPKFIPATWVLTIFSLASAFFWLFSTCCCSGRTRKVMNTEGKKGGLLPVQRTPYTYERVASPYQPGGVPLQPYGGASNHGPAMEPMRHQPV